jgi:hypothetical protein
LDHEEQKGGSLSKGEPGARLLHAVVKRNFRYLEENFDQTVFEAGIARVRLARDRGLHETEGYGPLEETYNVLQTLVSQSDSPDLKAAYARALERYEQGIDALAESITATPTDPREKPEIEALRNLELAILNTYAN